MSDPSTLLDRIGVVFAAARDAARLGTSSAWQAVLAGLPDRGRAADRIARFSVEQADAGLNRVVDFLAKETGPIAKGLAASGVTGVQEEAKALLAQVETAYRTNLVGKPEKAASGMFDLAKKVLSDPVDAAWSPARKALVVALRAATVEKMPDLRRMVEDLGTTSRVLLAIVAAGVYGGQYVRVKDGALQVHLPRDLVVRLPGGLSAGLLDFTLTPSRMESTVISAGLSKVVGTDTAYARYERSAKGANTFALGYRATQPLRRGQVTETVEAVYDPWEPAASEGRAAVTYTTPLAKGGGQLSAGAGLAASRAWLVETVSLTASQALALGEKGQALNAGLYAKASAGTKQAAAWEGGLQAKARFGSLPAGGSPSAAGVKPFVRLRERWAARRAARRTYEPRGNPGIAAQLSGPLPGITARLARRTTPEPRPTYIKIEDRGPSALATAVLLLVAGAAGWFWWTSR